MEMSGEYLIPANRLEVWNALNDPAILKMSIPGCTKLEALDPQHLTAILAIKVGPVSTKFKGEVELSDIIEPLSYKISGEGKVGVAGFTKEGASVKLEENVDGTIFCYIVDAKIGRKLAQFGSRLIDSTSKKLSSKIFEKTEEKI